MKKVVDKKQVTVRQVKEMATTTLINRALNGVNIDKYEVGTVLGNLATMNGITLLDAVGDSSSYDKVIDDMVIFVKVVIERLESEGK